MLEGVGQSSETPVRTTPLENDVLQRVIPEYIDIWPHLHPDEPGFTFDSLNNRMLQQYEEMRYDRMMLKSNRWEPTLIELIGTEPILEDPIVYPSDHFGLYTELSYTENNESN
eukprot:TRINITY_DN2810_c0_g1_i2.p1 TRINITY_DN2810_c0_g1~~TRINITY_DN2810_c0_g1_i2.p1  ORF type:complete len:113 (-),score=16.83 TRINITY_DN2810_c0_g1_i2:34-372(-)